MANEFFIWIFYLRDIYHAHNLCRKYVLFAVIIVFVTGSNGELVCACVHGNEPANFIRTSDLQMHCKLVYGYTASGHSMKIGQLRCAIDSFESQSINFLTPAMQFQARMCYAVNVENQVSIDTTQRNHNKTVFDHVWFYLIWFDSSVAVFYSFIFEFFSSFHCCCCVVLLHFWNNVNSITLSFWNESTSIKWREKNIQNKRHNNVSL